MWQDNNNYPQNQYQQPQVPLQFYVPTQDPNSFYPSSRSSLEGNVVQAPQGSISSQGGYGGNIQPATGLLSAFGSGGFEGEPPLLEGEPSNTQLA